MNDATTQAEYTAHEIPAMLEAHGFNMRHATVYEKIIPMLQELGLVTTRPKGKRPLVHHISADTAAELVRYMKARQTAEFYNMPHSAHTWRMLHNLGYMNE